MRPFPLTVFSLALILIGLAVGWMIWGDRPCAPLTKLTSESSSQRIERLAESLRPRDPMTAANLFGVAASAEAADQDRLGVLIKRYLEIMGQEWRQRKEL